MDRRGLGLGFSTVQCIHDVQWQLNILKVYSGDWRRLRSVYSWGIMVTGADWDCQQRWHVQCVHGVHWWLLKETGVVYSSWCALVTVEGEWGCLQFSWVHVVHWWLPKESGVVYSSVCSWCAVVTAEGDWGCLQFSVFMVYSGDWSRVGLSAKVTRGDWDCLQFSVFMLCSRHFRLLAASRGGELKLVFTATGFTGSCQFVLRAAMKIDLSDRETFSLQTSCQ